MSYTCFTCSKPFEGPVCPRCSSKAVEIVGSYQEGLEMMASQIQKNRQRFYGATSVGVVLYRWKDDNGVLALARKDKLPLGTVWELWNKEHWSEEKCARIPDQKEIEVLCYVDFPQYFTSGEETASREIPVKLPNLLKAELQQIGIRVHENNTFTILLKNDGGESSESAPVALFAD